jgi:hypothetical protein
MQAELKEAAEAAKEAPKRLREAIVRAGERGETALEIARAIDDFYTPDYVGRIIRQALGKRRPGRKPRAEPEGS